MQQHASQAADDIYDLLFAERRPSARRAQEVLDQSLVNAAPGVALLVALYVYGLCEEKWEKTEDYAGIRTVLQALAGAHEKRRLRQSDASPDARLLAVVVRQAQLLDNQMGVEEALNCSCPVATLHRAGGIVAGLDDLIDELDGDDAHGGELSGLRGVVRSVAAADRCYFRNVAGAAIEVLRFVHPEPYGPPVFDGVVRALEEAEEDPVLGPDVWVSELRAHRAALEALGKQASEPQLRVDEAEVVYVYPFALRGIGAEEAVERALRGKVTSRLEKLGLRPATAETLAVNDLWDRGDRSEPGYSGTRITLPDITVETTAYEWLDDDHERDVYGRLTLSADVRLSRLGNHHVRITSDLPDAHLHYVNQALRRGSRAMGAEMLTSAEYPKPWEKVADYAELVIGSIARTLGAVPVVNFDAPFHVVLAAPSISVRTPNGDASPATPETLEQSLGATLLFHPVRHLATSLEEWIRYPPPAVRNLLRRQGYVGDAVVRTDNTTVVFMPKSPDWLVVEYREMVEFVASLPPLLTLWERQALTLDEELEKWLLRDPSVDTLHRHEIEILELEHDVRRQLAFLRSPALCRTRGQRQFLDDLWRAAGLPALERELERRLTQLTARQERIAAMIRRQEQEHNESLGRRVELVLALIAGLSVAGVLQWLNDVLNVEARIWALPQGILLAVVAALVFVVVWAWARKSERPS